MLSYTKVVAHATILQQLTGLSLTAFAELLPAFVRAEITLGQQQEQQRTAPRQRKPGGGRTPRLSRPEDRLLFILFYFKVYPLQVVQGFFCGLSQPQANDWIRRLTPILNLALGVEQHLPERKPAKLAQVLRQCEGLEFIIDTTERPIQRPKDKERQEKFYSGKKKRHTVKNLVLVDKRTKRIKGVGRTREGKANDKRVADEEDIRWPKGSTLWKDTGFQGYEPPGVQTHQPKKKPPKRDLTEEEQRSNHGISKERVGVEHAIGGAKVFHIIRDVYRNHWSNYEDLIFVTACGLHNLRCAVRQSA
jgi:hypothetical protein